MSGIMLVALGGRGMTVALTPANATTGANLGGHVQAMTATPAGGVGPFNYAWTVVAQDATYTPLTINSPAAATTDFNFPAVGPGSIAQARVRCTVTDTGAGGATAYAEGLVTHVDQRTGSPGGGGGVIP
jgi:hypothetical protein